MTHRLYDDLAPWWTFLAHRDSHAEEALLLQELMDNALGGRAQSIAELGCGGGLIASHFDADREVVLTDLSPGMMAQAQQNNPNRRCIEADMRTLRMDREFDAVLLHDAVMYLTSTEDLHAAFASAASLLRPGGVFLVIPDVVKENFHEHATSGGTLGQPGAQLLEWHWDPDPDDDTHRLDLSILFKDEKGVMQSIHESHTLGLFSSTAFVRALMAAGLQPVSELIWDDNAFAEVFCGRKS